MLFAILGDNYNFLQTILLIAGFLVAIMMALVLHEWAHAWAAFKSGDPTAKMMGRMTINPAKHVEPMGLIMFLFVGIGWAKPVPVNSFNYRNFRWGNFFVSIAGVTVNFILGFISSLGYYVMITFADLNNDWLLGIGYFFLFSMVINISLMIFNLLPIYPLDGYNMLRSMTKPHNKFMNFMRQHSTLILIAVLLISMFTGGIFILRDIITDAFVAFWGLMF